jgi:TonB-linked SusC/RagA family outer membrane protein
MQGKLPEWSLLRMALCLLITLGFAIPPVTGVAASANASYRVDFFQAITVSGTIVDEKGDALPGANVLVKGTTVGTTSDAAGAYTLNISDANATLVFSFIGYTSKEVAVNNQSRIDVNLDPDIISLSEVVVTGYGSQSKRDITGSVATIDSKLLLQTPSTNLGQALQGKIAGVTVGNENSPGGGVMVRIRGFGTINDNSPLYVIDGVPTKGDLNTLNLGDVESMQILKDASAASIYGSRAGNGVVIVTTKRGKPGKSVVTYDTYFGTQRPGKFIESLNTQQYADLIWEAKANTGGNHMANGNPTHSQFGNGTSPVIPDYIFPSGTFASNPNVARNPDGTYANYTTNIDGPTFNKTQWLITEANKEGTKWMDEIFESAPIQNHQLGASGGSEGGRYALSLNYFDQKGIMIYTNFKRYSIRANTEFAINKRVRVGENFQFAYSERVNQPNGNSQESNPISFAFRQQPIIPVYDVSGVNFGGARGGVLGNSRNPVADLWRNKDNVQKNVRLFGNAFAEVDIVEGLTAKSSFGIDYNLYNFRNYTMRDIESPEARQTNQLQTSNAWEWTWTWSNTLTYTKEFGGGNRLTAMIGVESIKNTFESFDATRTTFATDVIDNRYLSGGTGVQTNNGTGSNWSLASEFAKVNYALRDKYLLEGTIRRDRSSRFSPEFRSAVFPAFSAGWVFSEESFASGLSSWLGRAKLRAGWGQTGNQEIGNYNSKTIFSLAQATSFYDINGTRTSAVPGYEITQFGYPRAKWETTTSTNIGIDANMLNGKFDFSLDWYTRETSDMLFPVQVPLTAGVATVPFQNIASMTNKGIDLGLNYNGQAMSNQLTYSVGGNFSMYRNNVTKTTGDANTQYFGLNDERIQNFIVTQQDYPISSFFGYKLDGIFQTDEEALASAPNRLGNPLNENKAGRFKFVDTNEDGQITTADLTIIGNPHPKFSYGLNVSVNYKNFGLVLFGQGVYGNEIFNYVKYWTDFPTFLGNRSVRMLEGSWRPGATDAILPKPVMDDQVSILPSTYYVEDGTYFRMKNIQLIYNIPTALLSKIGMTSARVYVQSQNLFTITKYQGMDPEINLRNYTAGNDRQLGVDGGAYPTAKQFIMGVNLSF